MKSSKKIIVAIIIVLILLLMVGGAFAYVYVATDILKTDKELFFTYFTQITADDGFIDSRIQQFNEKKSNTPYENSGKITVGVEYPDDSMDKVIEKVNDLSIRFSGKTDALNQKVDQKIEIDYGNDVIFPVNYRQDVNKFGIQTDKVSKKFIAIRNENLEEFIENIGGESIASMPNKIMEITEMLEETNQQIEFTEEEKNQLSQIYGTLLKQELLEENFSSVKLEQSKSYTLELSNEQVKNIIIKLIETTKENTLLIDKINELILSQDLEEETIDVSVLDDLIKSINDEDISNIPNLKLTLVQSNKQLNQITIQSEENVITIVKNITGNAINYNINCDITETTDASNSNSIFGEETSESKQVNSYFNAQYTGLESLSYIQENYEFGFEITSEGESMKYDYKVDIDTQFDESVLIEGLDKDVAVFLNDYNETQVTNFLTQVGMRLLEINKTQMEELGLKEQENPILYSNPITMLGIMVYKMASETITNTPSLSDYEIQMFNERFTKYEGNNVSGADVNAMIASVLNSNIANQGESGKIVKVTLDGAEMSEKVDSAKTYTVEGVYDTEGWIVEMKITTNN